MKNLSRFKKCFFTFFVIAITFFWTGAIFGAQQELPKRITFASHKVGSSNNAIAMGLCKIASKHLSTTVAVRPGSGTSAWVYGMNKTGKPSLGIASIGDIWWAYTGKLYPKPIEGEPLGKKPFYKQNENLRVLVAGPRIWVGMVARDSAKFQTIQEAKGERLAGGYVGIPGLYALLTALLRNQGVKESEFNLVPVPSPGLGMQALIQNRADMALASVGMPLVTEANAKFGVKFLSLSKQPSDLKAAYEVFPGAQIAERESGPIGLASPTNLLTYPLMVTTSTHLPDHIAYELTKVWWEHQKETWNMHPAFKGWEGQQFVVKYTTAPYHNGAIKFFREKGIWTQEMDKVQKRLLNGEYPFLD